MSDHGLKFSKPGFDVKTAALKDLSFTSAKEIMKLYTEGSGSLVIPAGIGGGDDDEIVHNLGYVPFFIVWAANDGDDRYFRCMGTEGRDADGHTHWIYGSADTTKLYIGAFIDPNDTIPNEITWKYYYYIARNAI